MMNVKKMINNLLLVGLIVMFCSCEHKELCYDSSNSVTFRVNFDWHNASDALPASMAIYLFPENGDEPLRYDVPNNKGGEIRCSKGFYKIICVNSDMENVFFRNINSWNTLEAYSKDVNQIDALGVRAGALPRADSSQDERISMSPEIVWSDFLEIPQEITKNDIVITLYPKNIVSKLSVDIKNVANLKYVSNLSASISGMAGGYLLGKNQTVNEKVTIPFEVRQSEDKTAIAGDLLTFGRPTNDAHSYFLNVYAILDDGSKWYYTYDVTSQIKDAQDPKNVKIILDGLPIPKPIVNGSGLKPEVNEWQSIEQIIKM